MGATIETKVRKLDEEVTALAEDVNDLKVRHLARLDELTVDMTHLRKTVGTMFSKVIATQNEHTRTLDSHTRTLDEHTKTLDEHGGMLRRILEILENKH